MLAELTQALAHTNAAVTCDHLNNCNLSVDVGVLTDFLKQHDKPVKHKNQKTVLRKKDKSSDSSDSSDDEGGRFIAPVPVAAGVHVIAPVPVAADVHVIAPGPVPVAAGVSVNGGKMEYDTETTVITEKPVITETTVITKKPVITETTVITVESDITEVINCNWFKIHFGLVPAQQQWVINAWKTSAGKAKILAQMGRRATGVAINMGSDLVEVYATKWFKRYYNTAQGAAWIAKAWKTKAGRAIVLSMKAAQEASDLAMGIAGTAVNGATNVANTAVGGATRFTGNVIGISPSVNVEADANTHFGGVSVDAGLGLEVNGAIPSVNVEADANTSFGGVGVDAGLGLEINGVIPSVNVEADANTSFGGASVDAGLGLGRNASRKAMRATPSFNVGAEANTPFGGASVDAGLF